MLLVGSLRSQRAFSIGSTAFTADLAQLADVLNVPLPQVEQVQPEQLPPSD